MTSSATFNVFGNYPSDCCTTPSYAGSMPRADHRHRRKPAVLRGSQAEHLVHQRRLARAVQAEQRRALPRADVEVTPSNARVEPQSCRAPRTSSAVSMLLSPIRGRVDQ